MPTDPKSSERFARVERFDFEWTSDAAEKRQAYFDDADGMTYALCVGLCAGDGKPEWFYQIAMPEQDGNGYSYFTSHGFAEGFANPGDAVEAALAYVANGEVDPGEADARDPELAARVEACRATLRPTEVTR